MRQWPDRLYKTFTHYLIIATIFGEQLWKIKCVFRFYLQFLSEIFPILKRTEGDVIKKYIGLHVKNPIFVSDFIET
jgi:hypothetical protein